MMETRIMKALASLLALAVMAGTLTAEPPRIEAKLYPEKALPGARSYAQLVVTNDGETPVLMGNQLRVRIPGQEDEPVFHGHFKETEAPLDSASLLGPGESVRYILGPGPWPNKNGWICDPRLTEPGSRDLVFEVSWAAAAANDAAEIAELRDESEAGGWASFSFFYEGREVRWAQSAPVRHEILEPRGLDRQVWDELKQRNGGTWSACGWTDEIGLDVHAKYPQSRYTPDALGSVGLNAPGLEEYLEDAIRRNPNQILTPEIVSTLYEIQSRAAFSDPDTASAERKYAKAMDTLVSALGPGREMPPFLREMLQEKLDAHDQGTIRRIHESREAQKIRDAQKEKD
jgi:hypothetical protein